MRRQAEVDEVGALALHLYRKCRDCPNDEVSELAPRIRSIANSLDDLDDHLIHNPLTAKYDNKLSELLDATKTLLTQVQAAIKECSLLTTSNRTPNNSLNNDTLADLKSNIGDVAIEIRLLYDQLTRSDDGRVSKALSSIIREGDERRVTRLRQSAIGGFPEAWKLVQSDLEEKGVSKKTALECRPFVVEWIRKAEEEGRISPIEGQADRHVPSLEDRHSGITPITENEESESQSQTTSISAVVVEKILDPPRSRSITTPQQSDRMKDTEIPGEMEKLIISIPDSTGPAGRDSKDDDDDLFGSTPTRAEASSTGAQSQPQLPIVFQVKRRPTKSEHVPHEIPLPASLPTVIHEINRETRATSQNTPPSTYEKEVFHTPPRPPPKDPLPPLVVQTCDVGTPNINVDIARLSPLDEGATADLEENARLIQSVFSVNKWTDANRLLDLQIAAVENGSFAVVNDEPVQPDIRFLTFLQGVCFSYSGDFRSAGDKFDFVLRRAHVRSPLDNIDVAAARWLGQTLLMLHQSLDAALAWALCLHALFHTARQGSPSLVLLAQDMRLLNDKTNAFRILSVYGQEKDQDLSKILQKTPLTWKTQLVNTALEFCYSQAATQGGANLKVPALIAIQVSDLTMPKKQTPFEHDPLFRAASAINLLLSISHPKQRLNTTAIPGVPIGQSSTLFYKTRKGAQWLVDTLRECLEIYTIEYKTIQTSFLVRLSVSHCRIAYYASFAFQVRKVPLRSIYGLKLTEVLYTTRSFEKMGVLGNSDSSVPNYHTMRRTLMEQIKVFLLERESSNYQPARELPNRPELATDTRFELPANQMMPPELMGSTELPVELDSKGVWSRKKRKSMVPAPPPNVFELEG